MTNTLTIDQALQQAVDHHMLGQLQEAEDLYRAILQVQPDHPDANNNLGVLAVQLNQPAASLPYFKAAIDANPSQGQYWRRYIDALIQSGQTDVAREMLGQARQLGLQGEELDALVVRLEDGARVAEQSNAEAVKGIPPVSPTVLQHSKKKSKIKPDKSAKKSALHKEENPSPQEIDMLVALFNERRYTEAISLAQAMTERFPLHGFGWKALGAMFKQLGRNEDALVPMQKAAALSPDDAEAHSNLGFTLHELGRLDEAETNCRRAVKINPNFAEAHYNLGNTLQDMGRPDEAEASYRQALQIRPNDSDTHFNLGSILKDLGRLDEAEASYRRALEIKPDHIEAHNNLGLILNDLNRLDEAEAICRRALEINPDYAEAYGNLGNTLTKMGRLDEAEAMYRQALGIKSNITIVHCNLGNCFIDMGRLDEAETCYRRALEIEPDHAEAHNSLGDTLKQLGRLGEAEACFRRTLEIKPDYADAHNNLGNILLELGRLEEAEVSCRRALAIKPDFAEAHNNLGNILLELGRLEEAEASYRLALQIKPDLAEAYTNRGNVLKGLRRLDEAEDSHRQALQINPDFVKAHNNLGNALMDMGRIDEAEQSYRRALRINSGFDMVNSNLLFCLDYHPDRSAEDIYSAYQEYERCYGIPLHSVWRDHSNERSPNRRLRIGYVSPDFRYHVCRLYIEPLLSHHDKTQVEVFAYAELAKEDAVSACYKNYVEHWIPTKGMSDEVLAERIRSDGIDILVDLAGHSANNRLQVFSRKPAPVSLSWIIGSGTTTGLSAIDYLLADGSLIPLGSERLFTEQPWRLSTPAYCYRPNEGMGDVNALPALQRGYVTFGVLTRQQRINHHTIRVWSELLKAVPNARLLIDSSSYKDVVMQERLASRFTERGIARSRLQIGNDYANPWEALREIDISLDCFPNNTGTSLLVSLYMGVPFITLAARPSLGRFGAHNLQGVGHPEWIAGSEEEYIAKAVALANDLDRLAAYRASLRSEMERSPLLDEAGFTRRVEEAYRSMWKIWCETSDKT